MIPILKSPPTYWECPNCNFEDVTRQFGPHTRFHRCNGLKGLTAPMIIKGTKAKVEAKEREDYVGKDLVQRDGFNRPIMSVVTTREDGQDCTILAPCASVTAEAPAKGGK